MEIDVGMKLIDKVYDDLLRPSVCEVGNTLRTLIAAVCNPVNMLGSYIEELGGKIERKNENTPEESLKKPRDNVLIPSIINMSMCGDAPELRELYAELILKDMDKRTEHMVHPSYVSIIKELTPQEALVLVSFQNNESAQLFEECNESNHLNGGDYSINIQFAQYCRKINLDCTREQADVWLENLLRLKLLDLNKFTDLEYGMGRLAIKNTEYRFLVITSYGRGFIKACAPICADDNV